MWFEGRLISEPVEISYIFSNHFTQSLNRNVWLSKVQDEPIDTTNDFSSFCPVNKNQLKSFAICLTSNVLGGMASQCIFIICCLSKKTPLLLLVSSSLKSSVFFFQKRENCQSPIHCTKKDRQTLGTPSYCVFPFVAKVFEKVVCSHLLNLTFKHTTFFHHTRKVIRNKGKSTKLAFINLSTTIEMPPRLGR